MSDAAQAGTIRRAAEPPAPVLFAAREAELAALDRLPRSLWLSALTHSLGQLAARLAALPRMRAGLAAGQAPDDPAWPRPALAQAIDATFAALDLARPCGAHPELADQVLRSLLWHLDRVVDGLDRGLALEAAETAALAAFADDWRERTGTIDALVHVLGDAGDMLKNIHWDRMRGLLRSDAWQEVVRIRALLEDLPGLSGVIRGLGRAVVSDVPDAARRAPIAVMQEEESIRMAQRVTRVPDLPGQTRGVRRSGRVARMLPAEALLLGHPRLR
ncbi:MAG: hypothetical protein JNM90_25620, partial [Burkholderiales bacterium]|nr:hypothetical protein [Burkholderiales bacterium]